LEIRKATIKTPAKPLGRTPAARGLLASSMLSSEGRRSRPLLIVLFAVLLVALAGVVQGQTPRAESDHDLAGDLATLQYDGISTGRSQQDEAIHRPLPLTQPPWRDNLAIIAPGLCRDGLRP